VITVTVDDPRQTDVASLVSASDAFAQSIYPTDACSSLSIPELLADGVTVFVARDAEQRALGMAALVDRGDGSGELKRLYVDERGRGQGVATAVMDALEAAARAASIRTLQLQTGPLHRAAIALYERRGYAHIERFGPYTDDGYSVCMEKNLG
jgi:putative acetyltransferase